MVSSSCWRQMGRSGPIALGLRTARLLRATTTLANWKSCGSSSLADIQLTVSSPFDSIRP